MMPRTSDRLLDDQPFGERTMVMGAVCTDREKLRATTEQEHIVIPDVTEKLSSVGDLMLRESERQIGPASLTLVGHLDHPLTASTNPSAPANGAWWECA
jgi:hypothetical protein